MRPTTVAVVWQAAPTAASGGGAFAAERAAAKERMRESTKAARAANESVNKRPVGGGGPIWVMTVAGARSREGGGAGERDVGAKRCHCFTAPRARRKRRPWRGAHGAQGGAARAGRSRRRLGGGEGAVGVVGQDVGGAVGRLEGGVGFLARGVAVAR